VIQLGSFDAAVSRPERDAYVKQVETITRVSIGEVEAGSDRLLWAPFTPARQTPLSVATVQQGLKSLGFYGEIATNSGKTRGAYNVLVDLVTAVGNDLPSNTVKYTLLLEQDLELSPSLKAGLADARAKAGRLLG
jgi:hypothetical protein